MGLDFTAFELRLEAIGRFFVCVAERLGRCHDAAPLVLVRLESDKRDLRRGGWDKDRKLTQALAIEDSKLDIESDYFLKWMGYTLMKYAGARTILCF